MFGITPKRSDIKRINKIIKEGNLEQLKGNIFVLMRDIAFYNPNGEDIKDMPLVDTVALGGNTEQDINNLFYGCSSKFATDFIKELTTPEVSESRFISKKEFDFLRDVYSVDGSELKTFQDLSKKYGKSFNDTLTGIIGSLKHELSYENDLMYLDSHLAEKVDDYLLPGLISSGNEVNDPYAERRPTVKEAIDIIFDKNTNKELEDFEEPLKYAKKDLLLFLLEMEFTNEEGNFPKEKSESIDSRLKEIMEGETSSFVQYINQKYQVDFVPTDEMIEEFNSFKNHYNQCKLLEQKNNILYSKSKMEKKSRINIVYNQEEPMTEDDTSLYDFCIENNDKFNKSLNGKKKIF